MIQSPKQLIWFSMNIITGLVVYYALKGRVKDQRIVILLSVLCAVLIYIHPLPVLFLSWKYALPKKTVASYIVKFGLPYDTGKDSVIWKNMAGFDKTWVLDEQIKHTHPIDHIDFVYSTLKIPGLKPEHVCIISQATGSIFIDMLKSEATARCHYLVKNAVSLGFVQDVVGGKITMQNSRDEYGRRILNNIHPEWFKDPLNEVSSTLGEGGHHLVKSGKELPHPV